jgi:spore maturation protein CgeB
MNLDDRVAFFDYSFFRETRSGGYRQWAQKCDLNLTNNLAAVDWYRQAGADAYYFPQGFLLDPRIGPPQPQNSYKYSLSFVGSRRTDRAKLVDALRSMGIPVSVFGKGWKDGNWEDDLPAIYRNSQINLGIGFAYPFSTLTNLKGRDFECPGAGACYLTTYHWELGLHYEIGKEILCYRCIEELAELYSFYRSRPQECHLIALSAYKRAIREHTWEQRYRRLFDFMGFQCGAIPS